MRLEQDDNRLKPGRTEAAPRRAGGADLASTSLPTRNPLAALVALVPRQPEGWRGVARVPHFATGAVGAVGSASALGALGAGNADRSNVADVADRSRLTERPDESTMALGAFGPRNRLSSQALAALVASGAWETVFTVAARLARVALLAAGPSRTLRTRLSRSPDWTLLPRQPIDAVGAAVLTTAAPRAFGALVATSPRASDLSVSTTIALVALVPVEAVGAIAAIGPRFSVNDDARGTGFTANSGVARLSLVTAGPCRALLGVVVTRIARVADAAGRAWISLVATAPRRAGESRGSDVPFGAGKSFVSRCSRDSFQARVPFGSLQPRQTVCACGPVAPGDTRGPRVPNSARYPRVDVTRAASVGTAVDCECQALVLVRCPRHRCIVHLLERVIPLSDLA
mmetsp:Transcript_25770/g.67646  ORF Transcript_25770/g.67646 Transcript_25770/m.67646 type:complete len:400 (-) Transcript_25770:568-1767(-)